MRARQIERALGKLDRIRGPAGPQICLAQKSGQQGTPHHDVQRDGCLHGLLEKGHRVAEALRERVHGAEEPRHVRKQDAAARGLTERQAVLERREGLAEVPLAEVETADAEVGEDLAVGMIDRRGDSGGVFAPGDSFGEPSELRERPREPGSREHRRQSGQVESLTNQLALQQLRVPPVKLHRSRVVAQGEVRVAEAIVRHDPDAQLTNSLGEIECPLPRPDHTVMVTRQDVELGEIGGHLSEPALAAEDLRESLGLEEVVAETRELAERRERAAQMEPEIDGLFDPDPALGQMLERGERLFEERDRFSVG